jgi:hypothetical protein
LGEETGQSINKDNGNFLNYLISRKKNRTPLRNAVDKSIEDTSDVALDKKKGSMSNVDSNNPEDDNYRRKRSE